MNPRAELRDRLRRIATASLPGLKVDARLGYLASLITRESGLEVGAGTVKDWWYATNDDERRVDSRHMDWARSHDPKRSAAANDNAWRFNPRRSAVTEQVAA